MTKALPSLSLFIFCTAVPLVGMAETVVLREGFDRGSLDQQNLPQTAAWLGNYGKSDPTISIVEQPNSAGDSSLQIAAPNRSAQAVAYFDRIALAADETLALTFTFTPQMQKSESNGWNALRIGLFDSQGQPQTDHTSRSLVATGYSAWVRSTTNQVTIFRREATSGHLITSATPWLALNEPATPSPLFGFENNITYTISLALSCMAENSIQISYRLQGGNQDFAHTHIDTTPGSTTFDGVVFGLGTNIETALIDNVTLVKTP